MKFIYNQNGIKTRSIICTTPLYVAKSDNVIFAAVKLAVPLTVNPPVALIDMEVPRNVTGL